MRELQESYRGWTEYVRLASLTSRIRVKAAVSPIGLALLLIVYNHLQQLAQRSYLISSAALVQ